MSIIDRAFAALGYFRPAPVVIHEVGARWKPEPGEVEAHLAEAAEQGVLVGMTKDTSGPENRDLTIQLIYRHRGHA